MRCTAHTRLPDGLDRRCEREIGHAGLHRIIGINEKLRDYVLEFPNSKCWFPNMRVEGDLPA